MNTDNLYYKIYQKKTSEELIEVINNHNSAIDTKMIAFQILDDRQELTADLKMIREELNQEFHKALTNSLAENRYDTFSRRVFALWIDGVIISILRYATKPFEGSSSDFVLNFIFFASLFLPYLYTILFHGFSGQTIGKMIAGIKILDKSEATDINFSQAILRDVIPLIGVIILFVLSVFGLLDESGNATSSAIIFSSIILSWSILEIMTMIFNEKRRALHDYIAGTVVLRIKD